MPMYAAPGMHVEWVDDEAVVLDPETSRLYYLNPPAALVYALIQEYGFEKGMRRVHELHGTGAEVDEQLEEVVRNMVSQGLLIDE